eukprot:403335171
MPETGEQLFYVNFFTAAKCREVSYLLYSQRFYLYFAFSADFRLLIFNEHLNLINQLPMKTRLIQLAHFYEEGSQIITAGIDGCYIFNLVVKAKYDHRQAILLDPDGKSLSFQLQLFCKLEQMNDWVKGIKIDVQFNYIFAWDISSICFYALATDLEHKQGELIRKFSDLNGKDDYLNDILLFGESKTFIIGTHSGDLQAWKWQDQKKLIHTFVGHLKIISSLVRHNKYKNLFISGSLDNTIRVWCLERLCEVYCFDLNQNQISQTESNLIMDNMNQIKLMNDSVYAVFIKRAIVIGQISHLARPSIGKCYDSYIEKQSDDPYALMVSFDDNSTALISPQTSQLISTIFPPPTSTSDSEGKCLTQQICCMIIGHTPPPQYDCEMLSDMTKSRQRDRSRLSQQNQDINGEDSLNTDEEYMIFGLIELNDFLIFGFESGTTEIFKWDVNQRELNFFKTEKSEDHDQKLLCIDTLHSHSYFLTVAQDKIVKVWNIKKDLIREIKFTDQITQAVFANQSADIIVAHKGKMSIIYAKEYQPFENQQEIMNEHDDFLKIKVVATDNLFKRLKQEEDDLRNQLASFTTQQRSKKILAKHKLSQGLLSPQSNDLSENTFSFEQMSNEKVTHQLLRKKTSRYMTDDQEHHTFNPAIYKKALEEAQREQSKRIQKRTKGHKTGSIESHLMNSQRYGSVSYQNQSVEYGQGLSHQNYGGNNQSLNQGFNTAKPNSPMIKPSIQSQSGIQSQLSVNHQNYKSKVLLKKNSNGLIDVNQFKCGSTKAIEFPLISEGQLRKTMREQHQPMTRQKLTMKRISMNIQRHNDPNDFKDFSDIWLKSTAQSSTMNNSQINYRGVSRGVMSNKSSMTTNMNTLQLVREAEQLQIRKF